MSDSALTLRDPSGLRPHRLAILFPDLEPAEFRELLDDTKRRGVVNHVVVVDDEILDGRHRWLACRELGIPVPTSRWDGRGSLVGFVVAVKVRRRHLTVGQRAAIATEMLPLLEAEARERQRSGLRQGVEPAPVSAELRSRDETGKSAAPRSW